MSEKTFVSLVRNKILKPTYLSICNNTALHYFLKNEVRNYDEVQVIDQLELLFDSRIINCRNIYGETPLITLLKHNRNWKGCYYVVLCLLKFNPDINIVDNSTIYEYGHEGLSSVDYSIMYDHKFKKTTTEHILLLSYNYRKPISVNPTIVKKYLKYSIKLHYMINLINQTIKLLSSQGLYDYIQLLIYSECTNNNLDYCAIGNIDKVINRFELYYNLDKDKWDGLFDDGGYHIDHLKYFPNVTECDLSTSKIKLLNQVTQISPDLIVFAKEMIGSGGNSNVYRGIYRGVNVAMKSIKTDSTSCASTYKELNACITLIDSTKVVKFHGVVKLKKQLYIVMDLCKSSLYNELCDNASELTMKHALSYCRQVLECVQYVHSRNIIHRDLKSLNVLVLESNKLVLCDFGISRKLNETNNETYLQYKGTLCYSSPESLLLIQEEKERKVRGTSSFKTQFENNAIAQRKKCDVYSCTIVLWEIMTTFTTGSYKQPFNNFTLVTKGYIQKIPSSYPIEFKNLIENGLTFDPLNRPTIDELLLEFTKIEKIYQSNSQKWDNLIKDKTFIPDLVFKQN